MKKTALYDKHLSAGARLIPFAGYMMPVQYSGINNEHLAVRQAVGMFDVSHMGEFFIRGKNALDLIQYVTSNDAGKLYDGKIQYSCLPNEQGGIVDDLLVYRLAEDEYMLVVNASNIDKDWHWINEHNKFNAELENRSDKISLLAIQGPKAIEVLQTITTVDLSGLQYYTFTKGSIARVDDILISATGYTGAGGFELYTENKYAEHLWDAIMKAGTHYGIQPAGLGARDTLRLEMGYCLYGNDIDESTSPLEAGLGWITKFSKEFVNSANLLKQKEKGVSSKLVGFKMIDRGIARHGYQIINSEDEVVGNVTSGTMSPCLKKGIGMGYVPLNISVPGSEIYISIRDKKLKAEVVKLPFYSKN